MFFRKNQDKVLALVLKSDAFKNLRGLLRESLDAAPVSDSVNATAPEALTTDRFVVGFLFEHLRQCVAEIEPRLAPKEQTVIGMIAACKAADIDGETARALMTSATEAFVQGSRDAAEMLRAARSGDVATVRFIGDCFARYVRQRCDTREQAREESIVRAYALRKHDDAQTNPGFSAEQFCHELLYAISVFGAPDHSSRPGEVGPREERFALARYSGDSTLFEVACHLYFVIDVWAFANRSADFRQMLTGTIREYFLRVFRRVLPETDVHAVFRSRVELYGAQVRKGEPLLQAEPFGSVVQFILRTSENGTPYSGDPEHMGLVIDLPTVHLVTMAFADWNTTIMADLLDTLESIKLPASGVPS